MVVNKSDAIIILEGDGDNRVKHACNLYKQKYSSNLVFSGDDLKLEYGSFPLSYIENTFTKNNIQIKNIIHENKSKNTKEQAQQVIKLCLKNRWDSIIIVASNFHQYRAYLTFIQELYTHDLTDSIKIYNSPCCLSWFEHNKWAVRYDLLKDEFKKISFYQSKGDVCSYKKALLYLNKIEC